MLTLGTVVLIAVAGVALADLLIQIKFWKSR